MNHPCRSSHTFVPRVEHGGTQARALIKPAPITPSRSAYELLEEEERHSPPFGSALPDHVTAFTSTTLTLPPRGRDPATATATAGIPTMMSLSETSWRSGSKEEQDYLGD